MPSHTDALADIRALAAAPAEKVTTPRTRIAWLEDAVAAYEAFHTAYREVSTAEVGSPAYQAALKHLAETNSALAKVLGEGRPHV